MTVQQIFDRLCTFAPLSFADGYDNPGLLAGDPAAEVRRVCVALDVTLPVLREAEELGADLLLTHHPFPFRGIKSLVGPLPDTQKLRLLLERSMALICMHTNLDRAQGGVNDALAAALGLQQVQPLASSGDLPGAPCLLRIGTLPEPLLPEHFFALVRESLGCRGLRAVSAGRPIRRVAVGGGACGGLFSAAAAAGADAFVVGDGDYHDMLSAAELGLTLTEAGHFATEAPVRAVLADLVRELGPETVVCKSDADPVLFIS